MTQVHVLVVCRRALEKDFETFVTILILTPKHNFHEVSEFNFFNATMFYQVFLNTHFFLQNLKKKLTHQERTHKRAYLATL